MSFIDSASFGITEDGPANADSLAHPKLRSFLDWWKGAAVQGVPNRSAFDPAEHPHLLPNLFLVHFDGEDFTFRLYGEAVITIIGGNYRGKSVGRDLPPPYRDFLRNHYMRVLETGQAWRCAGVVPTARGGRRRFESVDVPLVRGDGPDTILGIIDLL